MRELYEEMRCILKLLAVTVGLYPDHTHSVSKWPELLTGTIIINGKGSLHQLESYIK